MSINPDVPAPPGPGQTLQRYDIARRALAEALRIDEVKDIRDKAEAMRLYARQAQDDKLQVWAAEIKLRAERRAGEMLGEMAESGERVGPYDGSKKTSNSVLLDDLRISKIQSSRWQEEASVPEPDFEIWLSGHEAGVVPTSAGLRKLAKQRQGTSEEIAAVGKGNVAVNSTAKDTGGRAKAAPTSAPPEPAAGRAEEENVVAFPAAGQIKGAQIAVPEGVSVEQLVRGGVAREGGQPVGAIAKSLGLGVSAYRKIRYVVLLVDREDLSEADLALARRAMAEINRTRQYGKACKTVAGLVRRIYGEEPRARPERAEAIRQENFDRVLGALTIHGHLDEVDIPHLDTERSRAIAGELRGAIENLKRFVARIEEQNR